MSGKRFNKVNAGIVFLLVLIFVGILLVEYVISDNNLCQSTTLIKGKIVYPDSDLLKGANVSIYQNSQHLQSQITQSSGAFSIGLSEFLEAGQSITIYVDVSKNGYSDNLGSYSITCGQTIDIGVKTFNLPKPDIKINSSDIFFDPEQATEFQVITINAVVHNTGDSDAGEEGVADVKVSFYKDNSSNLIGFDMIELAANSQNTASLNWMAEIRNHTIIVFADKDNEIIELNENNNQANKTIKISDEDFIKQDNVIFRYIYMLDHPKCEKASTYLPQLENMFGSRLIITKPCAYLECNWGNDMSDSFIQSYNHCDISTRAYLPHTITIGKKSINVAGDINYDKANYTCNFPEAGKTENQTFNQWIENICYQFEVKPNACIPCDLNSDGIIIRDYRELMDAYKCFTGVKKNCRDLNGNGITFKDWDEMKHEYECFSGLV